MKRTASILALSCSTLALAGCGPSDIASPGTGGDVIINNPAPAPAPAPSPTPTPSSVTPASGCPTIENPVGLTDAGTITGPTGTYRVCSLPSRITRNTRLTRISGLLYQLPGRVDVGNDLGAVPVAGEAAVTLTVDPGVIVYGGTGVSWLHVNRGNRINAAGTATLPIVFTSRDNVLGLNSENSSGQWGGVVLSGRAPTTDCTIAPNATPGTAQCERQTEGAVDPAIYGGATPADNSGTMRYVQIRYSGFVLSGNSELQSLTTQSVGSGTTLEFIQSHNSSDDGVEFFGGVVNTRRLVIVGAEDDNLDTDTGIKAQIQYVIAVQRPNIGDSMIEADSDNAVDANTPRQNTKLANFTFVQRSATGANGTAMLLRGGTDYTMVNGVVVSPGTTCLRISRPQTIAAAGSAGDEAGPPVFRSVVMQCGTPPFVGLNGVTNDQVATVFGAGSNNNSATFSPTLASVYINGSAETAVPAFDPRQLTDPFNPAVTSSYFQTTTYVGAVQNAQDTWYQGWTCDSAAASFGSNSACTTLPTT